MDETQKRVYTKIQTRVKELHGIDLSLDKIHRIVLHQGLMIREVIEIRGTIRLPYIGTLFPFMKRVERHYEKGKFIVIKNTLYDMIRLKKLWLENEKRRKTVIYYNK